MSEDNSKFSKKAELLENLVKNSFKAIESGYYETNLEKDYTGHNVINLKKKIFNCKGVPLITEIKFSSPSRGTILDPSKINLEKLVVIMENSGSCGISILTQPFLFNGSIDYVVKSRRNTSLPILMKDIIVSEVQIKAAKKIGADCILLIKTIFDKNLTEGSLEKLSEYAKKIGLQTIIETHYLDEFEESVRLNNSNDKLFDIIGINNRDLNNLEIDLKTTSNILSKCDKKNNIVLSESGIYDKKDIQFLKGYGADAFLVGTSLMENVNDLGKNIYDLFKAI